MPEWKLQHAVRAHYGEHTDRPAALRGQAPPGRAPQPHSQRNRDAQQRGDSAFGEKLRKQVVAQAFDPLATLANSTVEVEQLKLLMPQVDQAIQTEQRRVMLVARIISLAKIALRAAGVNLVQ